MGSENLQAVIVRGEPIRPTGDLERLYREYAEAYRNHDTGRWLRAGATIESLDFASFGTNDPTQYTLAVDRNNEHVADRFDELHPAILKLIGDVIDTCRKHDVDTSICGQAGSKPEMVQFLAKQGVTSISANIDAVRDVQHEVKRAEQKLLLDS